VEAELLMHLERARAVNAPLSHGTEPEGFLYIDSVSDTLGGDLTCSRSLIHVKSLLKLVGACVDLASTGALTGRRIAASRQYCRRNREGRTATMPCNFGVQSASQGIADSPASPRATKPAMQHLAVVPDRRSTWTDYLQG
jgi:hypothetical protein